jgi:hypothetical protein
MAPRGLRFLTTSPPVDIIVESVHPDVVDLLLSEIDEGNEEHPLS